MARCLPGLSWMSKESWMQPMLDGVVGLVLPRQAGGGSAPSKPLVELGLAPCQTRCQEEAFVCLDV